MKLAGAVLAGGKSSRMGVNKAWLRYQGRSLATRLLDQMDAAGLEPLVLNAAAAPEDLPGWVSLLPDDRPGQGPLEGLASVLRRMDRPVLVCAVDLPGVDAAALRALAEAYQRAPGPALVSRAADGWHPLLAVYAPSLLPRMEAHLARGQRALQVLIEEERLPGWDGAQAAWLANLNSPEDRAAWEAEHGRLEDP